MKIISFVEGISRGVLGGVPFCSTRVARALAEGQNKVVVNLAGQPPPGTERFVVDSGDRVLESNGDGGAFGIAVHAACGKWALSPSMLWKLDNQVKRADFVMLNSLYSFPVLVGFLLALKNKRPYGLWTHGVLAPFQRQVSFRKKAIYDRVMARRILDEASVLFFTAAGEREEVASLKLTTPSVVIPLGIDAAAYRELPARGWFRDRYIGGHAGPLVLFLGRVTPKKGLDILAEALKLLAADIPDVLLAIVGGGDPPGFENQVKEWLRQNGVEDRAVLTGPLTGSAKLSALVDADVFVLPSHAENFASAMFECMASGLPVVVSDRINFAPEVKRREAGLVVPLQAAEFAGAMARLLRDRTLRRRTTDNALRFVQDYSWERCGERLHRTIECLLRGVPLPPELAPK